MVPPRLGLLQVLWQLGANHIYVCGTPLWALCTPVSPVNTLPQSRALCRKHQVLCPREFSYWCAQTTGDAPAQPCAACVTLSACVSSAAVALHSVS